MAQIQTKTHENHRVRPDEHRWAMAKKERHTERHIHNNEKKKQQKTRASISSSHTQSNDFHNPMVNFYAVPHFVCGRKTEEI